MLASDVARLTQLVTMGLVSVFTIGSLIGITAFCIKRFGIGGKTQPRIDDDRLRHLEQAVDAIAVEVERISESQRFSARLLAERETTPRDMH